MMKTEVRGQILKRIQFLEANKDTLVIDSDTHLTNIDNIPENLKQKYFDTDNYYQGRPLGLQEILTEMEWSDVDMALIWQNPATTEYTDDKEKNYKKLFQANADIYKSSLKYPEKFIPAGWVDPAALRIKDAKELVNACVNGFGFPYIKMNPAQNRYPIDSPAVFEMVRTITDYKAVPAFHFGSDTPYTPLEGLIKIADEFPDTSIIAVHMGGGGAGYIEAEKTYDEVRKIGLKYPNLKFVHSAKRDTHMESDFIAYTLAGEPYSNNIMCASDAPYGRMSWNFGGFRAMLRTLQDNNHPDKRLQKNPGLIDDGQVKRFLGGNMAKLTIDTYKSILDHVNTLKDS